jgi:hypothetical protein
MSCPSLMKSHENISKEMGVTIGKIIINAVKMFFNKIKPALYESKALEIFKLLNLNSRKNTQLKLMLNIYFTNYYCLNLKRYRCILKINMNINQIIEG